MLVAPYIMRLLLLLLLLLYSTGIRVLPRNFRNSSPSTATCKDSLSLLDVFRLLTVFADIDTLRKPITSFKQILR